jgi:hypothetical protein
MLLLYYNPINVYMLYVHSATHNYMYSSTCRAGILNWLTKTRIALL